MREYTSRKNHASSRNTIRKMSTFLTLTKNSKRLVLPAVFIKSVYINTAQMSTKIRQTSFCSKALEMQMSMRYYCAASVQR